MGLAVYFRNLFLTVFANVNSEFKIIPNFMKQLYGMINEGGIGKRKLATIVNFKRCGLLFFLLRDLVQSMS